MRTVGKIFSNAHPYYTKIFTLLITYITEIRRTFYTLVKFITGIKFTPNGDIPCLVYVKLKLIGKVLTLLQQTGNSVAGYLYLLMNCMIVWFIHFHHVHSFFRVRSSLSQPHNCIFGTPFGPAP